MGRKKSNKGLGFLIIVGIAVWMVAENPVLTWFSLAIVLFPALLIFRGSAP